MIDTPIEIYARIIDHFISAHAEPTPEDLKEVRFIPRGYLTPLLRVSKRWYANSAKYLYRSIAVGSDGRLPGKEIAKALHRTLKANPELAALVERLQLGIQYELSLLSTQGEWTKWNVDILQLCPNVAHVQIQGYQNPAFDALLRVLEEKSLVSFSISSRCLSIDPTPTGGRTSKIFNLMQHWPKLRSFQMQGGQGNFYFPRAPGCCPDLREIEITHVHLAPNCCRALRTMCSGGVTKFSVWSGYYPTHELLECLREWSATLEYLRLVDLLISFHRSHLPLTEAVSTLTELRILEIEGFVVDFGVISNLPRLERVYMKNGVRWELGGREELVQQLSALLKNPEKFPSLTHIAGDFAERVVPAVIDEFLNICRGRDIQLGYDYSAFEAHHIPTHRRWSI